MHERMIRKHELLALTGLSVATIWRMEQKGTFPRRRQIGPGSVGWLESEVRAWIESRPFSDLAAPRRSEPKAAA